MSAVNNKIIKEEDFQAPKEDLLKIMLEPVDFRQIRRGKRVKSYLVKDDSGRPPLSPELEKLIKNAPVNRGKLFNRCDIFNLVRERDAKGWKYDIDAVCMCIFAWGGMHAKHFREVFENPDRLEWTRVAEKIRDNEIKCRGEAYKEFKELRDAKPTNMKNIGPAFFTKLIYFLMPENCDQRGYIMDTWAAGGINTLFGEKIVRLSGDKVPDTNKQENYERYCSYIEMLTKYINQWEAEENGISGDKSPDNIEFMLYGGEGHRWRKTVKAEISSGRKK